MEIRIKSPNRESGWPLIALHKKFVTVRQMFSADPATENQCNFPSLRRYTLSSLAAARPCQRVLMRTAPLSKRFNFKVYYHACWGLSTSFESIRKNLFRVFRNRIAFVKKLLNSLTIVRLLWRDHRLVAPSGTSASSKWSITFSLESFC